MPLYIALLHLCVCFRLQLLYKLSRSPGSEDEEFAEKNVEKNRYAARFPCTFVHAPQLVLHDGVNLASIMCGFQDTQPCVA